MKSNREIMENMRIVIVTLTDETSGGYGTIKLPYCGVCTMVWGRNEDGWEHVSIAPMKKRTLPTWDDMCILKDVFFDDEEEVHQIHPKKSEYVNMTENCLHLWRPVDGWKE